MKAVLSQNTMERKHSMTSVLMDGLKYEEMDLGFSQDDILQFLKECPEHKMW